MKRPIAILGSFLVVLSFAAWSADILTPLPGVSGQSTAQATFFQNDLAVKVTDASGAPVAGVDVNFVNIDGIVFFGTDDQFSGHVDAQTDASGVAVAPGLIGFMPGPTVVTASTVGSNEGFVTIPLTVVPGGTVRFAAISGGGQHATVNTAYAQPWVAQAFDANGVPVPRAATLFFAEKDQTLPSVTFNGQSSVWVRADDNGIAVSPYFMANSVSGHDEGGAMSMAAGQAVQSAFFAYTNMPSGGSGGGTGDGCGRQGKGNGNCGNSPAHSGGNGNNGNGKG